MICCSLIEILETLSFQCCNNISQLICYEDGMLTMPISLLYNSTPET